MKYRFLLLLLALLLPTTIFAADGDVFTAKTEEGVTMTFKILSEKEKTCQVGKGGLSGAVVRETLISKVTIPKEINGYIVTRIGSYALADYEKMTSVTIPNSITIIEEMAFMGCRGLTAVNIPNSVTSIGRYAFRSCSKLTSVNIPRSVTSIGEWAFSSCDNLSTITVASENARYDSRDNCNAIIETASNTLISGCSKTIIPNSVTSIGDNAFYGCIGLSTITIPSSVTSIGYDTFYGCRNLKAITVASGNTVYDSRNNCNAIIKTASNTLITGCQNTIIPNSVTSIGSGAFSGCSSLTSINIPSSVTSINYKAFSDCSSLTSINIPNSVTFFGTGAFRDCI